MSLEQEATYVPGTRFEIGGTDPSTGRYVAYDEIEAIVSVGLEGAVGYRMRSYGTNDQPLRAHVVTDACVQVLVENGLLIPMEGSDA